MEKNSIETQVQQKIEAQLKIQLCKPKIFLKSKTK